MSIEQLIHKIRLLHTEMKEITLAAGVRETTYDKVLKYDVTITEHHIKERLTFLESARAVEYEEVKKLWQLLPSYVWQRYKDFGANNLREVILLKEARKKLKKLWEKQHGETEQDIDQQSSVERVV